MKTQKITGSQLRGMIKEALEESVVEIALDEQISALKVKGSKRTLKESKKYHKLLEAKIAFMKELASGGDSSGGDKPLTGAAGKIGALLDTSKISKMFDQAENAPIAIRAKLMAQFAEELGIELNELSKVFAEIKQTAKETSEQEAAKPGSETGINEPVKKVEGGLLGGAGDKI